MVRIRGVFSDGYVKIEDLVTPSQIADVVGVSRSCVSNWIDRHPDFPQPIRRDLKVYDWTEVRRFRRVREIMQGD